MVRFQSVVEPIHGGCFVMKQHSGHGELFQCSRPGRAAGTTQIQLVPIGCQLSCRQPVCKGRIHPTIPRRRRQIVNHVTARPKGHRGNGVVAHKATTTTTIARRLWGITATASGQKVEITPSPHNPRNQSFQTVSSLLLFPKGSSHRVQCSMVGSSNHCSRHGR